MIRHWQSLPSSPEAPILFVCDELSATMARLKPVKMSDVDDTLFTEDSRSFSVWLLDFLIHEASMRQSVDRFVWVMTPLCTVQEAGVSASALKSLRNYTLASRENLKFADGGTAAFAAPKISTDYPLLIRYQTMLFERPKVNAYSHDSQTWLPIPTLAQQDIAQLSQSAPTLKYWGDLPIATDFSHQWNLSSPLEVFTFASAQSFMMTDPIVEIINSEPDANKREALTIAYQWALARRENGAAITRSDFLNRAKNDRQSAYLRDHRDEIWDDLQGLMSES